MEYHNKKKSLDSLLINEEEVYTIMKHRHSQSNHSKEVSKEEVKSKKHRHHKHKSEHRRRDYSREQKLFTNRVETNITQEIKVDQQGNQCIIKQNTTICNHGNNHQKSDIQESPRSPTDSKHCNMERSVPHCFRTACREPRRKTTPYIRQHDKQKYCKAKFHHHRDRKYLICMRARHEHSKCGYKHTVATNDNKKVIQHELKQAKQELQYEDISSSSFGSFIIEKPSSYRDVTKPCEKQVSKLDTLIKRAKERERKLVEQSRKSLQWSTSTPFYTEISSKDIPESVSDIDLSLHSRSTLVIAPRENGNIQSIEGFTRSPKTDLSLHSSNSTLILEPKETGYSPIESFYMRPKTEEILYSPISPDQNKNFWTTDIELKIKSESSLDIEAYSPIQSPELQTFEFDKTIIKEP